MSDFLDELLRHEGRGYYEASVFPDCPAGASNLGIYWCVDCMGGELYCQGCIVKRHAAMPLHRIEVCALGFLSFTPLTMCSRAGQGPFSSEPPSRTWDYVSNWAIREDKRAIVHILPTKIS